MARQYDETQRYEWSQAGGIANTMRLPNDVMPTSYLMDEEHKQLFISWSDGHESVHPYEMLRRDCPCAWCAGEGGMRGSVDASTVFTPEQTTLYELQPIGRYGLTPVWGDGHHTGIYTYERLRASCQCDECREARAEALRQRSQRMAHDTKN